MSAQQQIADLERNHRRINLAKYGAKVSQVIDNVTVTVKLEVKKYDTVDVETVKSLIISAFQTYKDDSADIVYERANKLFLSLSELYNDNKISIEVLDSNNCGLTASYYNHFPQQLIKI